MKNDIFRKGDFVECFQIWASSYTKIHKGGIYEVKKIVWEHKNIGIYKVRIINDKGYLNNYDSRCFKLNVKIGREKKLKKLNKLNKLFQNE